MNYHELFLDDVNSFNDLSKARSIISKLRLELSSLREQNVNLREQLNKSKHIVMSIYTGDPPDEHVSHNFMVGAGKFISKRCLWYLDNIYDKKNNCVSASKTFNLTEVYENLFDNIAMAPIKGFLSNIISNGLPHSFSIDKLTYLKYNLLTSIFCMLYSQYTSSLGYMFASQIFMKSYGKKAVVDMFQHVFPGGISYQRMMNNRGKIAKKTEESLSVIKSDNILHFVYDNNGKYNEGTSEASKFAITPTVWTQILAIEQFGLYNWQFNPKYLPSAWKPLLECPIDFMDFNNKSRPGSALVSDMDIKQATLTHLVNGYRSMFSNLSLLNDPFYKKEKNTKYDSNLLYKDGKSLTFDSDSGVALPVACELCIKRDPSKPIKYYSNRHKKCQIIGCPNNTKNGMKSYLKEDSNSNGIVYTKFKKRKVSDRAIHKVVDDDEEFQEFGLNVSFEDNNEKDEEIDDDEGIVENLLPKAQHNFTEHKFVNQTVTVCTPVMVNPNSIKTVGHVYHSILTLAGVIGPKKYGRLVAETSNDCGSHFPELIDDYSSELSRLIVWLGHFHIDLNVLALVYKLIQPQGLSQFFNIHGFRSPGQVLLLTEVQNFHKSRAFLRDLFTPAIVLSLLYAIQIKLEENNDEEVEEITWETIDRHRIEAIELGDDTVINQFHVLDILIAFEMITCGQFENVYAGIRFLFPYMLVTGMTDYVPGLAREVAILDHRCLPEFREYRKKTYSLNNGTINGKSYDQLMEEINRSQKQNMPDGVILSELYIKIAAFQVNIGPLESETVNKSLGIEVKNSNKPSQVHHQNVVPQIKEMYDLLNESNTFQIVENRSFINQLGYNDNDNSNNNQVFVKSDLKSLYEHGIEEKNRYMEDFIAGNKPIVHSNSIPHAPKTTGAIAFFIGKPIRNEETNKHKEIPTSSTSRMKISTLQSELKKRGFHETEIDNIKDIKLLRQLLSTWKPE